MTRMTHDERVEAYIIDLEAKVRDLEGILARDSDDGSMSISYLEKCRAELNALRKAKSIVFDRYGIPMPMNEDSVS